MVNTGSQQKNKKQQQQKQQQQQQLQQQQKERAPSDHCHVSRITNADNDISPFIIFNDSLKSPSFNTIHDLVTANKAGEELIENELNSKLDEAEISRKPNQGNFYEEQTTRITEDNDFVVGSHLERNNQDVEKIQKQEQDQPQQPPQVQYVNRKHHNQHPRQQQQRHYNNNQQQQHHQMHHCHLQQPSNSTLFTNSRQQQQGLVSLPAIPTACFVHQPDSSSIPSIPADFFPSNHQLFPVAQNNPQRVISQIPTIHFPSIVTNNQQHHQNVTPLTQILSNPPPPPQPSPTPFAYDQQNLMYSHQQQQHQQNIVQQIEWQLQLQKSQLRQQHQQLQQPHSQQQQIPYQNNAAFYQSTPKQRPNHQQQQQQQQQQHKLQFIQTQQQQHTNPNIDPQNLPKDHSLDNIDHIQNNSQRLQQQHQQQQQQQPQISQQRKQFQSFSMPTLEGQQMVPTTDGSAITSSSTTTTTTTTTINTTNQAGVNLYVKHLDDDVDDSALKKMFSRFGEVVSAKVMMEGQISRGFGFVCFARAEDAARATRDIRRKTDDLNMKNLYVAPAQRKEERQAFFREKLKTFMDETAHGINQEHEANFVNPIMKDRNSCDVMNPNSLEISTTVHIMTPAGENTTNKLMINDPNNNTTSNTTTKNTINIQPGEKDNPRTPCSTAENKLKIPFSRSLSSPSSKCKLADNRKNIFDLENFSLEKLTVPLLQPATFPKDKNCHDLISQGKESQSEPIPEWFFESDDTDDNLTPQREAVTSDKTSHWFFELDDINNSIGQEAQTMSNKAKFDHFPSIAGYSNDSGWSDLNIDLQLCDPNDKQKSAKQTHYTHSPEYDKRTEGDPELATRNKPSDKGCTKTPKAFRSGYRSRKRNRNVWNCKLITKEENQIVDEKAAAENLENYPENLDDYKKVMKDCIECCNDTDSANSLEDEVEEFNQAATQKVCHGDIFPSTHHGKNNSNAGSSFLSQAQKRQKVNCNFFRIRYSTNKSKTMSVQKFQASGVLSVTSHNHNSIKIRKRTSSISTEDLSEAKPAKKVKRREC